MSQENDLTILERIVALKKRAESNISKNNSIAAKLKSFFNAKVHK